MHLARYAASGNGGSQQKTISRLMSSYKQFPPIQDDQFTSKPGPLLVQWINDAKSAGVPLPTVASLASASVPGGRVSSRMLNFQNIQSNGEITAYSDFATSRKAHDLKTNNKVAVTFYWQQVNRSVRMEGTVKYLSEEDAEKYFKTRTKDFQASVLLGSQSHPFTEGRDALVKKFAELQSKPESELHAPKFWYGATVVPDWFEFWQGNPDRVSDRIEFTFEEENNEWKVQRLTP